MKMGLVQMDTVWHSVDKNLEKAEEFIRLSHMEGCDVVVFPEMFTTGFSMNTDITVNGNDITGPFLAEMSKRYGVYIIGGYVTRGVGDYRGKNTACIYDRKGQCIATYTKIKRFSIAGEERFYEKGSSPIIFNIDYTPSSVFVCYDLRFPEIFRKVARDVRIIFVIANWPSTRREHWKTLLRARAIENQCFVAGVNRTGVDGNNIHYSGESSVFDPWGDEVLSSGEEERMLVTEIDTSMVDEIRREFPFLKDMEF